MSTREDRVRDAMGRRIEELEAERDALVAQGRREERERLRKALPRVLAQWIACSGWVRDFDHAIAESEAEIFGDGTELAHLLSEDEPNVD
jgi:hypothetical protein